MATLEETLLAVWRQALVENLDIIAVGTDTVSVHTTPKQNLKQVDFEFQGRAYRGLEQNPDTKSRWAEMARSGAKVMQFLGGGRYVAVVADGKVHSYRPRS
ncbi:MAG: hypothetical protein ABSG69_14055 [Candidatus Acidiferrum sp.]|jgi:hypothetical protein